MTPSLLKARDSSSDVKKVEKTGLHVMGRTSRLHTDINSRSEQREWQAKSDPTRAHKF